MNGDEQAQYVEADKRARSLLFAFYGIWFIAVSLCKWLGEQRLARIGSVDQNASQLALDTVDTYVWYTLVPMSFFLFTQGIYLLWMGIRTFRAGVHPPPATKMPFRTKVETGKIAWVAASLYLLGSVVSFTIIALLSLIVIMPYLFRMHWL